MIRFKACARAESDRIPALSNATLDTDQSERVKDHKGAMDIDSLESYLSRVADLRRLWKVPDHQELWFRAEDEAHSPKALQPGLYRPRAGTKGKSITWLRTLPNLRRMDFRKGAKKNLRLNE